MKIPKGWKRLRKLEIIEPTDKLRNPDGVKGWMSCEGKPYHIGHKVGEVFNLSHKPFAYIRKI